MYTNLALLLECGGGGILFRICQFRRDVPSDPREDEVMGQLKTTT